MNSPEVGAVALPVTDFATSPVEHFPTTNLMRQVASDLRWSFRWPFTWLAGVAFNLVLSLLYLVVAPLTGQPHRDWAILVGTYFAVFILADVTTTNVLGADATRVRLSLERGTPLRRILLVKNLTLLIVVGLPTLLATALITLRTEPGFRLVLTLPVVAFWILTWLGVGNLVSVLLPVSASPLRQRWLRRREWVSTVRWLAALGLPYALCVAVDPVGKLPRDLSAALRFFGQGPDLKGTVTLVTGLVLYLALTWVAVTTARVRELRFYD